MCICLFLPKAMWLVSPTFVLGVVKCETGSGSSGKARVGRKSPKRKMLQACLAQWLKACAYESGPGCVSLHWLLIP